MVLLLLPMAFNQQSSRSCANRILARLRCVDHIRAGAAVDIIPECSRCVGLIIRQVKLLITLSLHIWFVMMTCNWILG